MPLRTPLLAALACLAAAPAPAQRASAPRVLVFSRTTGFRHSAIESGIAAIRKLAASDGFVVDATEDPTTFTDRNLKRYRAVVFLSTTGDVLNPVQEDAFERYIQAGGGYVGIHSATDTEYDWPWYGKLAGAYFNGHPADPNVRKGTFRVRDSSHVSTRGLPASWPRTDEFYNFRSIAPDLKVLVDIDESSYQGGTNGANHPMSWYHDFDGGRAWYTNMGHTEETFSEPLFLTHLSGGIRYAIGTSALDYRRARPEENRFTKVVLAEKLNEPTELAVLPDERVLFIERRGAINLFSPKTKQIRRIGSVAVSMKYTTGDQAEDGLLGLAADPGFMSNGWIYLYYSPAGPDPKNVLARFTIRGDTVDPTSRVELLEVKVQRDQCCHTGGSIAFDGKGNLYLSTGDNSNPFANGYSPNDEREGRSPWDAQKSSGNTNDLRGKVIRIHPEPDGSYTIPAGNLFPPGTPKTRPEIYTMGHRNPYRIAVDKHTGILYWGDVGPDASVDSLDRGPMGYDEVNRAPRAGNYGWPFFVGDNKPYAHLDWTTMQNKGYFDPAHPINESPNNSGLRELPPAQPAFIWYPYGPSKEFPLVGSGGRTAMAGPVVHLEDFERATRPWPSYYDGRLLTYDWMRGWIMAVTMNGDGSFAAMERFLPSQKFSNPVDMEFGPNGDLYVLEYGTTWFKGNDDSRLVRLEYNAGNRAPVAVATADRTAGALPLRVKLSAAGTTDADDDSLRYAWTVRGMAGTIVRRLAGRSPSLTLTQPGNYTATLTATDAHGARASASVRLAGGNEPPTVAIDLPGQSRTFVFPGTPIRYTVRVSDREDGSLERGRIAASRVRVTSEYVRDLDDDDEGLPPLPHAEGKALLEASDCLACHKVDATSVGPAYTAVAAKYRGDTSATARLVKKIRAGGSGVWGKVVMPAHPLLSVRDAERVVAYVLSLGEDESTGSLPPSGELAPNDSLGRKGGIILRASYTDRGAPLLLGARADATLVLRSPHVVLASGELSEGAGRFTPQGSPIEFITPTQSGSHAKLARIDLTGIAGIVVSALAPSANGAVGGAIELHLDSPSGPLAGAPVTIPVSSAERSSPYRITLQQAEGVHDLYFVFRNEQSGAGPLLFAVGTATFERRTP